MKRVYLVLFCIVMILSLFGCGIAEGVVSESDKIISSMIESIPSTETSSAENSSENESVAESSVAENQPQETISDSEAEEMLKNIDSSIPLPNYSHLSIDELINTHYEYAYNVSNKTYAFILPTQDENYNLTSLYVKYSDSDDSKKETIFDEEFVTYDRIDDYAYIATENAIWRATVGEKKVVYEATEKITGFVPLRDIIYFVEGGMLKVISPDGAELREIVYTGDVTMLQVSGTTKIGFRKVYHNNELLDNSDFNYWWDYYKKELNYLNALPAEQEDIEDKLNELVKTEYYVLDIADGGREIIETYNPDYFNFLMFPGWEVTPK